MEEEKEEEEKEQVACNFTQFFSSSLLVWCAHRSGGWAHYRKGGVGLIQELSPKLIEIGSENENAGWMMGSTYRWRQQTSTYN
jgi:hypothetical protein